MGSALSRSPWLPWYQAISSNSAREASSPSTALDSRVAVSAVEHDEQEPAQHHAVEHEGQEADAPDQVHQEGDGQDPGDEGESGAEDLVLGNGPAAFERVADGEDDGPRRRRYAEQKREARRVGPREAEEPRGGHGHAGPAGARDQRQGLGRPDDERTAESHVGHGPLLR